MRLIVRYISFILVVLLLIQCEKEDPYVKIADNNFLNALIELGIDTDGDGQISQSEAEVVISLDVSEYGISDLTGIEEFINLDSLACNDNQLSLLDVSGNTRLKWLVAYNNQLSSVNVTENKALIGLGFGYNHLYAIDVSEATSLYYQYCDHNHLTSLDISNNTNLGVGNAGYTSLYLNGMSTLYEVCVWSMPFPPEGLIISTEGSPNVYFTTECGE